MQKDCQNHQKEIETMANAGIYMLQIEQKQSENSGKSHYQRYKQPRQYRRAVAQLNSIFELQQSVLKVCPDDSSTSLLFAEKEITKCISELIQDCHGKTIDTDLFQSLLKDYRVFEPLPGKNPLLSLDRLHMVLQDNYADSYLCKLFNILFNCSQIANAKVITF